VFIIHSTPLHSLHLLLFLSFYVLYLVYWGFAGTLLLHLLSFLLIGIGVFGAYIIHSTYSSLFLACPYLPICDIILHAFMHTLLHFHARFTLYAYLHFSLHSLPLTVLANRLASERRLTLVFFSLGYRLPSGVIFVSFSWVAS